MRKVSNYIKDSLMWLWQLPQNMLALFIEGFLCGAAYRKDIVDGNIVIECKAISAAMSLGDYVFINESTTKSTIKHECGHCKQSNILGPLYLLVIGIPSLLHNIVHYLCYKVGIKWNYYSFYTEAWANKLAENIK